MIAIAHKVTIKLMNGTKLSSQHYSVIFIGINCTIGNYFHVLLFIDDYNSATMNIIIGMHSGSKGH